MILKSEICNRAYELIDFVNKEKIPRENIQQIIPCNNCWAIFWWENEVTENE